MDWNSIWNSIVEYFKTNGLSILYAILILILGLIIIKIILHVTNKMMSKSKLEQITQGFIRSVLRVLLNIALIWAVLQTLGVPLTGLTAILATAGAAIALSLKDSLSNVASGMIIISNKPFKQGDYVKIGAEEGTVNNINIMTTTIITTDNKKVVLPNSNILNQSIVNFSSQGSRRQEILFDIAYDADVELAKKVILDVCHSNGKIMLNPAPEVNLKSFGDSNVQLFLTCWSKAPYWEIYYYILDNVYNEFKRNNISIAYPQMEVRMRTDTPTIPYRKKSLPKRVEPKEEVNTEFSLFDIDSFQDFQNEAKRRKVKNLRKKQKQIESELALLTKDLPKNRINSLIQNKSIMLKNKLQISISQQKIKFHNKIIKKK